jgi:manganese transport protein
MAGQVIMQGFLHLESRCVRPGDHDPFAGGRIAVGLDPTRTLVISRVLLSFGLPFAIIAGDIYQPQGYHGGAGKPALTTLLAGFVAAIIVFLNIYLLHQTFSGGG